MHMWLFTQLRSWHDTMKSKAKGNFFDTRSGGGITSANSGIEGHAGSSEMEEERFAFVVDGHTSSTHSSLITKASAVGWRLMWRTSDNSREA